MATSSRSGTCASPSSSRESRSSCRRRSPPCTRASARWGRGNRALACSPDWERARKLLNVPSSSKTPFGQKAADKAEAITAGYVNLHIAAAGLMKDKDNAGCLSEAQLALTANPQSADAQSLVDACKKPQ